MKDRYLPQTWVSGKLAAGRSKIHGDGIFATAQIAAGEKLMEFGGEYIARAEAFSGAYRSKSVWPVDGDHYVALPKSSALESLDENLNHSCDANAWLEDEVTLVARREIGAGEEVTLDQGTWNFEDEAYADDHEACHCGAKECRHELTKDDWRLPDLQERYAGHLHPVIQTLVAAQNAELVTHERYQNTKLEI